MRLLSQEIDLGWRNNFRYSQFYRYIQPNKLIDWFLRGGLLVLDIVHVSRVDGVIHQ